MTVPSDFLMQVAAIAAQAGAAIRVALAGELVVARKEDASPVTNADHAAHDVIFAALAALTPDIPVISEEDAEHPAVDARFWCVDPLDGTRSVLEGRGEYTVNIALVEKGQAVLGVLFCPTDGTCYAGEPGQGAFKCLEGGVWQPIRVAAPHAGRKRAIVGARDASQLGARMTGLLEQRDAQAVMFMSSARKFGVLAEGLVDMYPRFARTFEWDTAAGQAIVEAAGGMMSTMEGARFAYGKDGFENGPFMAQAF